mgnify:FL=1
MLSFSSESKPLIPDEISSLYPLISTTPINAKKQIETILDPQSIHEIYSIASNGTGTTELDSENENFSYSSPDQLENGDAISPTLKNSLLSESPKVTSKLKKKKKNQFCTDRFIPSRKSSMLQLAFTDVHSHKNQENMNANGITPNNPSQQLDPQESSPGSPDDPQALFNNIYRNVILGYNPSYLKHQQLSFHFRNQNLLRYSSTQPGKALQEIYAPSLLGDSSHLLFSNYEKSRKISKTPFKVLDAPALQDDFYLNLIDWSTQNTLAVGLSSCVYLWSAQNSKVTKLCDLGVNDTITSVSWAPRGGFLSVGTNSGEVQIWDPVKLKKIRVMTGHTSRVGTLGWNSSVLTSGSRDKNIYLRDIRLVANYISKLVGHKQEVCGLKWSFDDQQLCSGGNDNKLFIWNLHSTSPIIKFTNHTAAVKALAWSPHQHGLLASGGGTADRTIRFWNTLSGTQVGCLDTGSQVCNLMFSKNVNELVSTHGYSLNQIIVWKYPSMEKTVTLTGHSYRVLYLAMSPDGQTIVTGAGDETLRFWQVFPPGKEEQVCTKMVSKLLPTSCDLR